MTEETSVATESAANTGGNNTTADSAGAMLDALSADKERLFQIIQDHREDVILAALRNPQIDQHHILTLLKRRELERVVVVIYGNKRLVEAAPVKLAIVAHPDSPQHIAQALLALLNIFDQFKLCLIPGVSADIRLAAERKIVQQIPAQPLGNKLTLARRGTSTILEALLREGLHNILEICLDNPHLKEGSLHQFLNSSHATADAVSAVARNSRWKSRPNIRLAILKNPRTPLSVYASYLQGLPTSTVRDLLASPRLTLAQKELLRKAISHSHK